MLEVRNLSKIYKSKNKDGVDTKALDGVSLSFAETGMVFLLGKSGSGKSTLLNICGGLDSPTSGEVIVKGRSSKDFSQTDFDSYRNTFVGFIFQEYNILNEFSVEDNIALALELQGKPKDKKAIAELLAQVDLSGYAKRKPNTLSGGQKQRIAIARALIKSPEIIMADEPTGALDSATGKQVFDTLKKLSKDKLVLVVSHDRDFAEQYGDRIIELKDGKVISDVSKTEKEKEAISQNVTVIGDVLCISKDADLGEKDFEEIKAYLKASRSDVIIANNEEDVKRFKKASRITDGGTKEVFIDTDEEKIAKKTYTKNESRFIRSKLPIRHAIKIGASSLKNKPLRLVFTILLCTISFVLFGLLSTLNFYNSESTFKETMSDLDISHVTFQKQYVMNVITYLNGTKDYEFNASSNGVFSDDEVENLKAEFGNDLFGGVDTMLEYSVRTRSSNYWSANIKTVAYLPVGNTFRSNINGAYPENDGEICISSYSAEMLVECKPVTANGTQLDVSLANDLIGRSIRVGMKDYKIVGIFDSGAIDPKYDVIKNNTDINYNLLSDFEMLLNDGMHLVAFVSENELKAISSEYGYYNNFYSSSDYYGLASLVPLGISYDDPNKDFYPSVSYEKLSATTSLIYLGADRTLGADNVVISSSFYANKLIEIIYQKMSSVGYDEFGNPTSEYEKYQGLLNDAYLVINNFVDEYDENGNHTGTRAPSAEEYRTALEHLVAEFSVVAFTLDFAPSDSMQLAISEFKSYNVIGVTTDQPDQKYGFANSVYFSDDEFQAHWDAQKQTIEYFTESTTNYVAPTDCIYTKIFAPYSNTKAQNDFLWNTYSNKEYDKNDSMLKLSGYYIDNLTSIDYMVKELSKVFLYVGLAFAVFAILLFSNFISVSISYKKKEIGILRAVGAKGSDVFKIFFSESFFIALICTVISCVGSISICKFMNQSLASNLGASIFVFGFASFVVTILIAFLTAVISTFLPVYTTAKKKPVDSIRSI